MRGVTLNPKTLEIKREQLARSALCGVPTRLGALDVAICLSSWPSSAHGVGAVLRAGQHSAGCGCLLGNWSRCCGLFRFGAPLIYMTLQPGRLGVS